jgi:hypothetical protein
MTPPAGLTAIATQTGVGLGLFYAVVKFFDTVGDRLSEDTRLEIAVWLLDLKSAPRMEKWPATFAKLFDRVFGKRHLSFRCFWRSGVASFCAIVISSATYFLTIHESLIRDAAAIVVFSLFACCVNLVPDYLSLLETRYCLRKLATRDSVVLIALLFIGDLVVTGVIAWVPFNMMYVFEGFIVGGFWGNPVPFEPGLLVALFFFPAFFTSLWLWLYAGSGLLLKGARRVDVGFRWFNSHFDIEKKPLQSIGLVAGAIVAVVYWGLAAVMRIV